LIFQQTTLLVFCVLLIGQKLSLFKFWPSSDRLWQLRSQNPQKE